MNAVARRRFPFRRQGLQLLADLRQLALQPFAAVAQILQLIFQSSDFGIGFVQRALSEVNGVGSGIVTLAHFFDTRFGGTQIRRFRFDLGIDFFNVAQRPLAQIACVALLNQPQQILRIA